MPLDDTAKIITQSTNTFSTGDIIALVVAIISLAGVIVSTVMTNRTTKKINKSNEEFQEKWNQKNIDATLIANARIEWIQKVRNTTAELLVHYFSMLKTVDNNEIQEALLISQEKTELLILFFGHEEKNINCRDRQEILKCKEHNNGKNDLLVEFLVNLSRRFGEYCSDVRNEKYQNLEQTLKAARNEAYSNATQVEIGVDFSQEGEEMPLYEPRWQQEDIENVTCTELALRKEEEKIRILQNDLVFLRDVMRTYLKIEWNIAKTGK